MLNGGSENVMLSFFLLRHHRRRWRPAASRGRSRPRTGTCCWVGLPSPRWVLGSPEVMSLSSCCCCCCGTDSAGVAVRRRTAGSQWCSPSTTRPRRAATWRRASTSCAAPPGSPRVRPRVRVQPVALSRTSAPEHLLLQLLQLDAWAEPAAPRHPWWSPK